MKAYRVQPQARSHVYRSVLIERRDGEEAVEEEPGPREAAPPPTPGRLAGTARVHAHETRGDLIKFYNSVCLTHCLKPAPQFITSISDFI